MEIRINLRKMKEELKSDAKTLREDKMNCRESQRLGMDASWSQEQIHYKKVHYRYKHIAYSMMRGKTYEQIERTVRPGNEANMSKVEKMIADYKLENSIIIEEIA